MKKEILNKEFFMPNVLLVAGNGRNVGKTWFACRVISHLAKTDQVTAIKVSSHFHPYKPNEVLLKNKHFIILEERNITQKDSSLMLQSGANKVYFVMTTQENLREAFLALKPFLPHHAIVCESGGLHQILTPGLFFYINKKGKAVEKKQHLKHHPIEIVNNGRTINFDVNNIGFSGHGLVLK